MKKKTVTLLVCAMAASMILGACSTEEAQVEDTETEEGETEVITADEMLASTGYDVTEYVTLPDDYMDLTVELTSDYNVTDDEIQEYVEQYILAYYPAYDLTDKTTVEDGDIVNIDFVGTIDGEEFDGGSAEGFDLTIGSDTFIDGFEEGLIGQEVGTTVDLNLTFPDDYSSEDLAGQDVVFTVTINGIMEETTLTYDEITDEYVEDTFGDYGMTTVDDLMADVEDTLESSNESLEQSEIQDNVLQQLVEKSTINYPEELLDERLDSYLDQVKEGAEEYEMDYEDYVVEYSEYDDVETFESDSRSILEEYLEQELILEAIVADQQISITRSEFDEFVDVYVAYYGFESAEEFYEYYGGEDYVMLNYAENIALDNVVDAATIVLPDGESETGQEQAEETEEAIETEEADEEEALENAEETQQEQEEEADQEAQEAQEEESDQETE